MFISGQWTCLSADRCLHEMKAKCIYQQRSVFLDQGWNGGLPLSPTCENLIEQTADSPCISRPPQGVRRGTVLAGLGGGVLAVKQQGQISSRLPGLRVSLISQWVSLISRQVVNLLACVCPRLHHQVGANFRFWLCSRGPGFSSAFSSFSSLLLLFYPLHPWMQLLRLSQTYL